MSATSAESSQRTSTSGSTLQHLNRLISLTSALTFAALPGLLMMSVRLPRTPVPKLAARSLLAQVEAVVLACFWESQLVRVCSWQGSSEAKEKAYVSSQSAL
jgi:hypothetical protein